MFLAKLTALLLLLTIKGGVVEGNVQCMHCPESSDVNSCLNHGTVSCSTGQQCFLDKSLVTDGRKHYTYKAGCRSNYICKAMDNLGFSPLGKRFLFWHPTTSAPHLIDCTQCCHDDPDIRGLPCNIRLCGQSSSLEATTIATKIPTMAPSTTTTTTTIPPPTTNTPSTTTLPTTATVTASVATAKVITSTITTATNKYASALAPTNTTITPPVMSSSSTSGVTTKSQNSCYMCSGPPSTCLTDINEVDCTDQGKQLCRVQFFNNLDGSVDVYRSCESKDVCLDKWRAQSSRRSDCTTYSIQNLYWEAFNCTLCCTSPYCNRDLVPTDLYSPTDE